MSYIYEWFGYAAADNSQAAADSARAEECPFTNDECAKKGSGGVCSVQISGENVAVCPNRLYFNNFEMLQEIANEAFANFAVANDLNGMPLLTPGRKVHDKAKASNTNHVGVFGKHFPGSGEVKLPPAISGGARYSVDYTLCVVDPQGHLKAFVPVEVQSIDTTNGYKNSLDALRNGRKIAASNTGMNWENVNKRILPQLIVKGLMLQAEALCTTGIYFVTPEPVYKRIMRRLGGEDRLREIPQQPGSITFLRYDYDESNATMGSPVPLERLRPVTISTSDMSLAFISPENLPPAGAYSAEISSKL